MPGLLLDARTVEDHESLCPAAAPVGETVAGSGCLCRITGNVITTGENPSSLRAFCWNRLPAARAQSAEGELVEHGYQNCPAWRYNRLIELRESDNREFVSSHTT